MVLDQSEIVGFWGWAAQAAPQTIHEVVGEAPHLPKWFLGAAGAAQTCKINDFRTAPNHALKAQVYIYLPIHPSR